MPHQRWRKTAKTERDVYVPSGMDQNAGALQNANTTAWQRVLERVEKLKIGLEKYKPANGNGDMIDNIKELADRPLRWFIENDVCELRL